MEYRKVQITGERTFIVSLPKKWVDKNKINKGDILIVEEEDDALVFRSKDKKSYGAEIQIKPNVDLDLVKRLIITRYIQGYDAIFITSKKHIPSEVRKSLGEISGVLMGLELFGGNSQELTLRMLMREMVDIIDSVSRMQEMSAESIRELIDYLENNDRNLKDGTDLLSTISLREEEIDKFYFLILRQLSSESSNLAIPWVKIVDRIEEISDNIEKITRAISEGEKIKRDDINYLKKIMELYNDVMLALRSKNIKIANDVINSARGLLKNKKPRGYSIIYERFHHILEDIEDIAESVINLP